MCVFIYQKISSIWIGQQALEANHKPSLSRFVGWYLSDLKMLKTSFKMENI